MAQPLASTDAQYDAQLAAPACTSNGARCDSNTTLTGRGTVGPESNAPNTLGGSCADGNDGTFQSDASVEALRVSTVDGVSWLAQGRTVKVEADVWGAPSAGSALMLFRATDATAPQWVHLATLPAAGGAETLSTTFTLPTGSLQAVRAVLVDAAQAQGAACTPGAVHDHDDLAFAVSAPDVTQPTVTHVPAAGATVSGQVTLVAQAVDDQAMGRVDFFINNTLVGSDTSAPFEASWDSFSVPNGSVTWMVRVYDAVGNARASSVNLNVRNDYAAPTVNLIAPVEGKTVGGWVSVVANASDDIRVTQVEFYLDDTVLLGTSFQSQFGIPWDAKTAPPGLHTLTARAYDASGKVTTSVPVNITVDPPPTVAVTSPAAGAVLSRSVPITATVADNAPISRVDFRAELNSTILCNGYSPTFSCSWPTQLLPNGPTRVRAEVHDAAGNLVYSEWVTVMLDNDFTAPTATVTAPVAGATVRGSVVISVDASDNRGVTQVEFMVDGKFVATDTTAPYTFTWNSALAANGSHTVFARAWDAAYNLTSSATVSFTVDNDTVAPAVSFTSPVEGAVLQGTVTLEASASDDHTGISRVEFYRGTTLLGTDTTEPFTYDWATRSLANGAYTLTAKAYDGAGNVGSTTRNVTLSNDFTAPTVSITYPAPNDILVRESSYVLTASASDNVGVTRVEFFLDGMPMGASTSTSTPYSKSWYNYTTPGSHSLSAKAYDAAGNVTTSASVTVTVNYPPPANYSPFSYSARNTSDATVGTVNQVIAMVAGQTFTVGTCGVAGSAFTGDTYLRLFNANGTQVAFSDNACGGAGSSFVYTVPSSGNYYLNAGCSANTSCTGTVAWTLSATAGSGPLNYSASNTSSATVNTVNQTFVLAAGQTLTLGTCGVTGASFTGDTYLRLFNANGTQVTYSDDACGGTGSNFVYTVPAGGSGSYQLRAGCYSSNSCSGTVAWTIR
ncbi:Ig-like domain-containing protein [Corallococcus exercitus]|uniref:Ig-like domain-containing protein n=1 Tax=Corallococcus exercitus TaxID=2316736 RepID=A0A7Y4KEP5_9BACT|nr:Ig-like domain-containing protein [Corallococcus exercitus]